MELHEVLLKLATIEAQIARLISDRESEKDTRRRRNQQIDQEINELKDKQVAIEKRQDKSDYFIWAVGIICLTVGWILANLFHK